MSITGARVKPEDMKARDLADLLHATSALVEASADYLDLPPPHVSLSSVRRGSCLYDFAPGQGVDGQAFETLLRRVLSIIGGGDDVRPTPDERHAIGRILSSHELGPTSLAVLVDGKLAAPPVEIRLTKEHTTSESEVQTLYAECMGVELRQGSDFAVTLKPLKPLHAAGARKFRVVAESTPVGQDACVLIGSQVEVDVYVEITNSEERPLRLIAIRRWEQLTMQESFESLGNRLEKRPINTRRLLASLRRR